MDMLTHAGDALTLLGDSSLAELRDDLGKRHGVVRCIEVVGEAGHQVSDAVKAELSAIPWHLMYGMRNRLIHDYGNTNYRIVYEVVRQELPGLIATLRSRIEADQ